MDDPIQNLDAFIARLKSERKDRRQNARLKTARRIRIIFPGGAGAVSAMLVDLSKSGARLRVLGSKSLPSAFALELERDLIVPCEVVHQHDGHVGVKFQRRSG